VVAEKGPEPEWHDLGLSYEEACHAMQAGVAMEISRGTTDAHTPKHLRVGVNSAMTAHTALAYLLVQKNIITMEEYEESLRLVMNNEVHLYQQRLGKALGRKVKLI